MLVYVLVSETGKLFQLALDETILTNDNCPGGKINIPGSIDSSVDHRVVFYKRSVYLVSLHHNTKK